MNVNWRKFRKAIGAGVIGVVEVLTQWGVSGQFNRPEIIGAVGGLVTTAVVYLLTNEDDIVAKAE